MIPPVLAILAAMMAAFAVILEVVPAEWAGLAVLAPMAAAFAAILYVISKVEP